MTADAPSIVLEREGAGFRVRVLNPPPDFEFSEVFDTYRRARGHGCGLRMVRGWALDDRTNGGIK